MALIGATRIVLSAALVAFFAPPGLAAEQARAGCRLASSGPSMISAEGPTYDVPGGAKMGYVLPGTKYARVATVRHTDGTPWILLSGPGGMQAGWIRSKDVTRRYLPTLDFGCAIKAGRSP